MPYQRAEPPGHGGRRGARGARLPPGPHAPAGTCGPARPRSGCRTPRPSMRCGRSGWPGRPITRWAASRWACGSGWRWPSRCSATRGAGARRAGQRAGPGGHRLAARRSCAGSPRQGRSVLVSSHLLAEIEQTVDQSGGDQPRAAASTRAGWTSCAARAGPRVLVRCADPARLAEALARDRPAEIDTLPDGRLAVAGADPVPGRRHRARAPASPIYGMDRSGSTSSRCSSGSPPSSSATAAARPPPAATRCSQWAGR